MQYACIYYMVKYTNLIFKISFNFRYCNTYEWNIYNLVVPREVSMIHAATGEPRTGDGTPVVAPRTWTMEQCSPPPSAIIDRPDPRAPRDSQKSLVRTKQLTHLRGTCAPGHPKPATGFMFSTRSRYTER